MGDVKNVIGYLCKYLNLLLEWTDAELAFKPEYIRLAKYNKTDQNVVSKIPNLTINISKLVISKIKFQNLRKHLTLITPTSNITYMNSQPNRVES